jgi:hypothetical protein
MEEIWNRYIENLFARLDGPLHFRFIAQPLMATIFAVIDGIKDAKLGNPPYFWTVVSDPQHRKELLKLAWKRVGKIFIFAVVLDVIYQLKVNHWVYPGETLTVAILLAIVPYIVLRGPINRLAQLCSKKKTQDLHAKHRG